MQTQNGRAAEGRRSWEATNPGEELRTYRMAFLTAEVPWNFPVEGCPERAATMMAIRVQFFHRHVRDTVIILEEGNLPHPRSPLRYMLVPWPALNRRHLATSR